MELTFNKERGRFEYTCRYNSRREAVEAGFTWDAVHKVWHTYSIEKAHKLLAFADVTLAEAVEEAMEARARRLQLSAAHDDNIDIPAPDGLEYLPFQKAGIAYALSVKDAIIADDMGLGKTIQAIGVWNADDSIKKTLVICPASLKINWGQEFLKWAARPVDISIADGKGIDIAADVVIVNYDRHVLGKYANLIKHIDWDLLIIDEAHYLKNPKTQRTKEVLGTTSITHPKEPIRARRRLFLTGTPILNRPIELWPILASMSGEWGTQWQYAHRYCAAIKGRWGWDFKGASNLDELNKRLRATCMIRRKKEDVLTELPPKRRQIIEMPCAKPAHMKHLADERFAYRRAAQRIASLKADAEWSMDGKDEADYKQAVKRLRAGASAAFHEIATLRKQTALIKLPQTAKQINAILKNGEPIVVFAHHHEVIDGLVDAIDTPAVRVDGRVNMNDRADAIARFQDGAAQVFIGGIQAAGVGITLTAASTVVFAELDWTPGLMTQAEDRCHRIGQDDPVLIQHLVLERSLDATMARKLVEKQEVLTRAIDGDAAAEKALATRARASRFVSFFESEG